MSGRVMVFGGTGFFGSAVVREGRDRGLDVRSVARGHQRDGDGRYPDLVADITRAESLTGILHAGDLVLHLVGLSPVRRPPGGRRAYYRVHTAGTRTLLGHAANTGAAGFVYVSALGVHRGCGAAYGETKALAEAAVRRSPLPSLVVSPSLLFGPGSEITDILAMIARLAPPVVPVPDLRAPFRPIHVADAARVIIDRAVDLMSGSAPRRSTIALVGPELLTGFDIAAEYLKARGVYPLRFDHRITNALTALVSRIAVPGAPAELEEMLALDNAGNPPPDPTRLIRYSNWARSL